MPFALAAGGIGAVGSIVGGGKQAGATRDAAKMQADSAQRGIDLQSAEFNKIQANEAPFLNLGQMSAGWLQDYLDKLTLNGGGFNPAIAGLPQTFNYNRNDFQNDPAFQFVMDQGQKAIERTAAAKGGLLSPATQQRVAQFAEGTADQFYGEDYNRAQDTFFKNYANAFNTFTSNRDSVFNKLSSLTGLGLNAAAGVNAAGTNFANNAGEYTLQQGNAGAAGVVGAANAAANEFGGTSASIQNLLTNPSFQSMIRKYAGGGGSQSRGSYGGNDFGPINTTNEDFD